MSSLLDCWVVFHFLAAINNNEIDEHLYASLSFSLRNASDSKQPHRSAQLYKGSHQLLANFPRGTLSPPKFLYILLKCQGLWQRSGHKGPFHVTMDDNSSFPFCRRSSRSSCISQGRVRGEVGNLTDTCRLGLPGSAWVGMGMCFQPLSLWSLWRSTDQREKAAGFCQAANTRKTKPKGVFKAHTHINFLFLLPWKCLNYFFLALKEVVTEDCLLLLSYLSHTMLYTYGLNPFYSLQSFVLECALSF